MNTNAMVPAGEYQQNQIAYLNTNWLDAVPANSVSVLNNGGYATSTCLTYTYPWGYYYGERKITLTMSEVEHLRECAKKDKKLKAALQKIAPHIEVAVDF